jgi:hypothetical protein
LIRDCNDAPHLFAFWSRNGEMESAPLRASLFASLSLRLSPGRRSTWNIG